MSKEGVLPMSSVLSLSVVMSLNLSLCPSVLHIGLCSVFVEQHRKHHGERNRYFIESLTELYKG